MSPLNALERHVRPNDPKLRTVSALPLFEGLGSTHLRYLTRQLDEVAFAPGDVLMRQGSYDNALYLVVGGEVEVTGDSRHRRTVGAGEWFGECSMLRRGPAAATAVAKTAGRAMVMSRAQFRALKSCPSLLRRLRGGAGAGPAEPGGRAPELVAN